VKKTVVTCLALEHRTFQTVLTCLALEYFLSFFLSFFLPYFLSQKSVYLLTVDIDQCFSTFERPQTGKFFFIRRGPGPNKFTRKYLSIFKVHTLN